MLDTRTTLATRGTSAAKREANMKGTPVVGVAEETRVMTGISGVRKFRQNRPCLIQDTCLIFARQTVAALIGQGPITRARRLRGTPTPLDAFPTPLGNTHLHSCIAARPTAEVGALSTTVACVGVSAAKSVSMRHAVCTLTDICASSSR